MRFAAIRAALLLGIAALAGCAHGTQPVGADFTQSAFASFVLNQTSDADVTRSLGEPYKRSDVAGIAPPTSTAIAPGARFTQTTLEYVFEPRDTVRSPSKHAHLVFFDNRLVAYIESSSVASDVNTAVDEQRLPRLRQGGTTRRQAINLLGTPNIQVFHLFGQKAGTATIAYFWGHIEGNTLISRLLVVDFDRHARLSTYTVLDQSNPVGTSPLPLPAPAPQEVPQPQDQAPEISRPIPPADLNRT